MIQNIIQTCRVKVKNWVLRFFGRYSKGTQRRITILDRNGGKHTKIKTKKMFGNTSKAACDGFFDTD